MDEALGAPAKMVEREDELTPMIRQYVEACRRYEGCLVLFHVGDFYKTFEEAAEVVSRRCELALTSREDNSGEYTMTGIPVDSAESYVERLLDAGYRVAVAEQVEDPEQVSGVADRAVTRVLTPGTLTEDELLDGDDHTFVAALAADDGGDPAYGFAVLDVSTGDFYATALPDRAGVRDEVSRFAPAEVIVGPAVDADDAFDPDCTVTAYDPGAFGRDAAAERVADYFGDPAAHLERAVEVRACGALLAYAEYARGAAPGSDAEARRSTGASGDGQRGRLDYINHLTRYDPRAYVLLDAVARRSLELFERRAVHGAEGGALVDVVDETACALGRRELTDWLRRPLLDADRIEARHEAVGELKRDVATRERLQALLADVYDVERLVSRVSRGRANARDLRSLKTTLDVVPDVRAVLADAEASRLRELRSGLDELADVRERIDEAIAADPPVELTEGGVIREEYSEELDDMRATERSGKAWIDDLQERERERTGIDSLKVGHNAVHGYYIEVTDPNLDAAPDDYHRRQTLKNAERFYTPALKEREDEIIEAEHRADDLEYELFVEVRDAVAAETERVQALADGLARLDALAALGTVAATYGYTRPVVGAECVAVEAGRHPVVERTQASFVPNDTDLDRGAVAVLTGPNMSGKSTYMRQVALLALLAQAGSFVPADAARLPVVDRVFTRVGASDDIAGGQSTFMVEMVELAEILESATEDSLVLLDEVGRGTSTADGLAIARAVTEFVHDEVGATTLFATHHHELTELAAGLPRARNLHFAARQEDGEVVFDHEIAEGAATASYGVEVAGEAGVPDPVVARARELLDEEAGPEAADDATAGRRARAADGVGDVATLVDRLEELDVATMTPIEALNALADLKEHVGDGEQ
jgi:DNA mismatch repair protein MutS